MKRLLATTAFLAVAANAQAADLAVKAPYLKAPVAMVYDWTGFYVGVNAGLGVGRNNQTLSFPGFPSFEQSYLQPFGALGGVQAGYNWQTNTMFGRLVLGVEADIQGAGLRDDYTCLLTCRAVPDISGRFDQRLDWFGTVRGRVGFANGPVLRYFTGGFAYGSVKTSITENIPLAGFPATFTSNQTRGGWTIGSGVEAALGGNWTAKIEYLQVDLGNKSETFALGGFPQTLDTEIRQNIYRVGLNYRIGGNGLGQENFLPLQKGEAIYELKSGIKIGVIGLATLETPASTSTFNDGTFPPYQFLDYAPVVLERSNRLREAGAHAVLILSHVGNDCNADNTFGVWDESTPQKSSC